MLSVECFEVFLTSAKVLHFERSRKFCRVIRRRLVCDKGRFSRGLCPIVSCLPCGDWLVLALGDWLVLALGDWLVLALERQSIASRGSKHSFTGRISWFSN